MEKMSSHIHELEQDRQECDALRAQIQLLRGWAHEIRTPLGAIIGFSQLLLNTDLTTQQGKFVDMVCRYSGQLLEAVNVIFDFIGLETGTLTLNKGPFHLHQCLERAVIRAQKNTPYPETRITYNSNNELPQMIIHDETYIERMVYLLILAALHQTGQRDVRLSVEYEQDLPISCCCLHIDLPLSPHNPLFMGTQREHLHTHLLNSVELILLSRFSLLLQATIEIPSIQNEIVSFILRVPYQPIPMMSDEERIK